jgi:EAL and modified HD-GYP domain-containing signal transduction protein
MSGPLFVARQPIFDARQRIVAYELLFRSSAVNAFSHPDPDRASLEMMNTTLLGLGLGGLVGDKDAFFNVSRSVLLEELYGVLPTQTAVLEVLETIVPDAGIVAACRASKAAGYRIALDDFVDKPEFQPLLEIADYVKVDFLATKGRERGALVARLAPRGIRMLAEKVETHEDFKEARKLGYCLFQGYFFCRPEMVTGEDVPAFQQNLLRFVQELHRPELDYDKLVQIIKTEVSLSVKLLRYLNSAGFGWRHGIASIEQALLILGERPLKKWASLVALTMLGESKPHALVVTSLIRAQFCERIGAVGTFFQREADLFLMGLLSVVDAILNRPLGELLRQMSVSDEIKFTLLGERTLLRNALDLAISYDRGDWDRVSPLARECGLAEGRLPELYRESVQWAEGVFEEKLAPAAS